jgi:uncharacterized RDD family membrane protein YckC
MEPPAGGRAPQKPNRGRFPKKGKTTKTRPQGTDAVYYRRQDYAGFWRRICIDLVDFCLVAGIAFAVGTILFLTAWDEERIAVVGFFTCIPFWYVYLVLLKRSAIRTLGYRVARVRIVNLQGRRPSVASLTMRFLFIFFGPLTCLLDLFWIPGDRHRQALRDKFAHTYVIGAAAQPAGRGELAYVPYCLMGWTFVFQEVKTKNDKPPRAGSSDGPEGGRT